MVQTLADRATAQAFVPFLVAELRTMNGAPLGASQRFSYFGEIWRIVWIKTAIPRSLLYGNIGWQQHRDRIANLDHHFLSTEVFRLDRLRKRHSAFWHEDRRSKHRPSQMIRRSASIREVESRRWQKQGDRALPLLRHSLMSVAASFR